MLLSTSVWAQNSTVAYVDAEAVVQQMTEYREIQNTLGTYQEQQRKMLKKKTEETAAYYVDIVDKTKAGLMSVQQQKEAESKLQDMQDDLDLLKLQIDRGLIKRDRELTKPKYDKFKKALVKVAQANDYHYIIDKQFILGVGTTAIDATAKIKSALGIK